jgi:hypothetical protein
MIIRVLPGTDPLSCGSYERVTKERSPAERVTSALNANWRKAASGAPHECRMSPGRAGP